MDRKTVTIVLAAVLIGAFFLPYIGSGMFKLTGFDFIKGEMNGGAADRYLVLLTPLAGLLLLVGAVNKENYIPARPICSLLALAGALYVPVRMMIETKGEGFSELFKVIGVGIWVALAASLILLFYNPKPAS